MRYIESACRACGAGIGGCGFRIGSVHGPGFRDLEGFRLPLSWHHLLFEYMALHEIYSMSSKQPLHVETCRTPAILLVNLEILPMVPMQLPLAC